MDDVRFYGELALVREGIEKIHEALPDYKYVPMRDVREAMYPEKMTTEQLAEALDEIAEAFDPYEYRDNVETGRKYGAGSNAGFAEVEIFIPIFHI